MRSNRSYIVTLLLCFFLGCFGLHRFYAGKPITGLLMLITFGFFGIWALLDFLVIAFGQFKDGKGNTITP